MISLPELHAFHSMDRKVFKRLVINLMISPCEALLIMATWLWLEDVGYSNIIARVVLESSDTQNFISIVNEAIALLNCVQSESDLSILSGQDVCLAQTTILAEKPLTLKMISRNRFTVVVGIKSLLNSTCSRIFNDILQIVLVATNQYSPSHPFRVPGFPHPIFGSFQAMIGPLRFDNIPSGIWGWNFANDASKDDRTLFLTFSKGFPVFEDEVRQLFTRLYGECIEKINMGVNIYSNEHPLYAKLVMHSITTVDRILNGRTVAKYRINGKHVWARKYDHRGGYSYY